LGSSIADTFRVLQHVESLRKALRVPQHTAAVRQLNLFSFYTKRWSNNFSAYIAWPDIWIEKFSNVLQLNIESITAPEVLLPNVRLPKLDTLALYQDDRGGGVYNSFYRRPRRIVLYQSAGDPLKRGAHMTLSLDNDYYATTGKELFIK
jgi:hypothetical protein